MHFEMMQLIAIGAAVTVLAATLFFTAATGALAGNVSQRLGTSGPAPVRSLLRRVTRETRARRSEAGHVRAQRRRLALVAGFATVVMLLIGAVRGLPGAVPSDYPGPGADVLVTSKTHTVRPGDTVWSIARDIAGDSDPRPVVDEIIARNALPPTPLAPGTVLNLP